MQLPLSPIYFNSGSVGSEFSNIRDEKKMNKPSVKPQWGFWVPIRNGNKIKFGYVLMITDGPGGFDNYLQGIFYIYFCALFMFLWKTSVFQNIFVVNSYI